MRFVLGFLSASNQGATVADDGRTKKLKSFGELLLLLAPQDTHRPPLTDASPNTQEGQAIEAASDTERTMADSGGGDKVRGWLVRVRMRA